MRTVNVSNEATPWDPNVPDYFFTREDLTVLLAGADALTYRRYLRDINQAVAVKQILSRGAVHNLANTTFAHILRKGMNVPRGSSEFQTFCDNELKELKKALEQKPETWEILNHACGIDKVGLPVTFGKVSFVLATPDVLNSIPEATITRSATREAFADKVLSRVHVQAVDVDAARTAATRVIQQTFDCLNFFASIRSLSGQAYLVGEKATGHGYSISISSNNVLHGSFLYGSFLYGPFQSLPFPLLMEVPGFGRVSRMLASNNPSELEDRILKAIQWAGRAFVDLRLEESFLLMAIALESLLLSQKDENIGYRIALRCAHLIGKPDLAARKTLVKDIRGLYSRRSAIVHSGNIEVSDADIALLHHYLRVALFVVIEKEPFCSMTDEQEFEAWFEDRILEATPNQ